MADNMATPPWFSQAMIQMAKAPQLLKPAEPTAPEQQGSPPHRRPATPKTRMYHFSPMRPLSTLHTLHTVKKHERHTRHK